MLHFRALAAALAGTSFIALAPVASAQDTQSAPAATTTQDAAPGDIVVTAQRRSERLQDVPLSVTAVTSDTLKSRDINSLAQLSAAAPSLQLGKDDSFSVRGAGTLAFAQSLESSVAVAQDEVNLVNGVLASPRGGFFDIERVEVLSGPQGLLFGKNASAGLINIVTKMPKIGVWGADVDVSLTKRDTVPTDGLGMTDQATINMPVTAQSALRVNAFYSNLDPNVKYVGTGPGYRGLRQWGFRGKYLANLSDALSLYVIGDYAEDHGIGGQFEQTYRKLDPAADAYKLLVPIGIVPGPDNYTASGNGANYRDVTRKGLQGKLSYVTGSGIEISDIAAYKAAKRTQSFDTDGTTANGADVNSSRLKYHQFTNELRVALPEGNRLSGQAGLYFYSGHTDFAGQLYGNQFTPDAIVHGRPFCVGPDVAPACAVTNLGVIGQDRAYTMDSKSYAGFGQLTYAILPQLKVFAGGRVTHDKISIDGVQNQGAYFVHLGTPLVNVGHFADTNFSYKVGAQYNVTPDIMFYGSYGSGYKGPGFAENRPNALADVIVRPETSKAIEVGLKSQWWDHRITFNVSLFRTKFKDYQVQAYLPALGSFVIQNAAGVTTKGIEFTAAVRPVSGFTLTASGTFLDSKFDDFPGAQCSIGQPQPCGADGTFNAAGLTTPVAPHFAGTVDARYEFSLGADTSMYFDAAVYHRSSIWYDVTRTPGTSFKAITTLAGSIGVNAGPVRVSVFCKNCTDERIPAYIGLDSGEAHNGRVGLDQQFDFDSFRTIGMKFGFSF